MINFFLRISQSIAGARGDPGRNGVDGVDGRDGAPGRVSILLCLFYFRLVVCACVSVRVSAFSSSLDFTLFDILSMSSKSHIC